MQELFEIPGEYDAMLKQGIGLTGNDRHFFIRGRFDFLQNNLSPDFRPRKILDFGCGTGDASAELARRFPDAMVTGSDPAEKALNYGKEKHRARNLKFSSGEELSGESFDLIFLNCVIHHVEPDQRKSVIQEIVNLLNEGGQLWIFENNPANPGTRWAMYRNPFDQGVVKVWPSELKKLMLQGGVEITGKGFLFYFPQWLAWLRPLEKLLVKFPLGGQYVIRGIKSKSSEKRP